MIKYPFIAIAFFCSVSFLNAQSTLPPYLLGEWQFVDNAEAVSGHVLAPMDNTARIAPDDQLTEDGVKYYFYEDNQFQKSIYTASNKELILGNGKVLSFSEGALILELEEMYMNGRLFGALESMPDMKYDTLNIMEMPPFHFKDILEYPSSTKRGKIIHDTLYFLKIRGLPEDAGE